MFDNPFFSVVIPTYSRPKELKACLDSITQLTYPHDRFEVIVVDDGSPMSLAPIVEPFKDQLNLTLISQPNAGPASARNRGVSQAKGQLVVFTDDDCAPAPNWLEELAKQFATDPTAMIGGRTLNGLPSNLFSTASQLLVDYLYSYYTLHPKNTYFFTSNNLAVPTDQFRQIGKFDTSFPLAAGEDRELCDRWHHHSYSALYAPEAQISHFHRLTLGKFWRQHFNYGRGAYHFHQLRSARKQAPVKVEPISFYIKLLTYPFSQHSTHSKLLLSFLFFLSQVANVSGFFWERQQREQTQKRHDAAASSDPISEKT